MPKIAYEAANFRESTLKVIQQANDIIEQYQAQGYDLTLRQLYYRFVATDLLANNQKNYSRLGDIVSKARTAGLIDWFAIVDRTRGLRELSAWDSPSSIVSAVAAQFRRDLWENQSIYVEVWFEKDALMGVFERISNELRVPFFSCRGYTSDSSIWGAAQRLRSKITAGKEIVVLHFGDHDPSGIDMTRDIKDRLKLFSGSRRIDVRRLALNMDQVEQYDPPPNPAKETDSRFADYQATHGDECWELDALEPITLANLVRQEVATLRDDTLWLDDLNEERRGRAELKAISDNYPKVVKHIAGKIEFEEITDLDSLDYEEEEDDEG